MDKASNMIYTRKDGDTMSRGVARKQFLGCFPLNRVAEYEVRFEKLILFVFKVFDIDHAKTRPQV